MLRRFVETGEEVLLKTDRTAVKVSKKNSKPAEILASGSVELSDDNVGTEREFLMYEKMYSLGGGPSGFPNLVQVYGYGKVRLATAYEEMMIMKYYPGLDGNVLKRRLRENILNAPSDADRDALWAKYWNAIKYVSMSVLRTLEKFHSIEFSHNDIKPDNIVVDARTGEVIVLDLGGVSELTEEPVCVTMEYIPQDVHKVIEKKQKGQTTRWMFDNTKLDIFTLGSTMAQFVYAPGCLIKDFDENAAKQALKEAASQSLKTEIESDGGEWKRIVSPSQVLSSMTDTTKFFKNLDPVRDVPGIESILRFLDRYETRSAITAAIEMGYQNELREFARVFKTWRKVAMTLPPYKKGDLVWIDSKPYDADIFVS
eukprot:jgi/Bigna1/143023/aug1.75_g17731